MAQAGKINVGLLMDRQDAAELTRLCAQAGITVADHIRHCLTLGRASLLESIQNRRDDDDAVTPPGTPCSRLQRMPRNASTSPGRSSAWAATWRYGARSIRVEQKFTDASD